MPSGDTRTDQIKRILVQDIEQWRIVLDHNSDLSQVHFIVQFRQPGGEIKRVIVKPEGHRDIPV